MKKYIFCGIFLAGALFAYHVSAAPDGPISPLAQVRQVSWSDALRFDNAFFPGFRSRIVWDGRNYGVFTLDINYDIVFSSVDANGNVVIPQRVIARGGLPRVVWDGSTFALAYGSSRDIYFERISSQGDIIINPTKIAGGDYTSDDPSIAWNGNDYGITWYDDRNRVNAEIYFERISKNGVPITPEIKISTSNGHAYSPVIAWSDNYFGLGWYVRMSNGDEQSFFAQVGNNGGIRSLLPLVPVSGYPHVKDMLWTGSTYVVAFYNSGDGAKEINLAFLTASGHIKKIVQVTPDGSYAEDPQIVWTGSRLGVIWHDYQFKNPASDNNTEVMFAEYNNQGNVTVPETRITNDTAMSAWSDIAWNGSKYAITWTDTRDSEGTIYFSTGTPHR